MITATARTGRPQGGAARPLGRLVIEAAARGRRRTAIVDGTVRLDHDTVEDRTARFAAALRRLGADEGDVVTVDLPNWWEAAIALHGALRAGCVANPVIPIYRDSEVRFILEQSGTRVLVIPHRFRGFDYVTMAGRVCNDLARPPVVVVVRPEGPLPDGFVGFDDVLLDERLEPADPDPDAVALLLYTSGTTAEPKGVLHSHRTLDAENRSIIELFRLTADDTVFMPSPVTHITGFLYGILLPPMLGAKVVLLDVWDPAVARQLIEAESCRFTLAATPFLQGLVDAYARAGGGCALRAFPCGGADVPPELVRRARQVLDAAVVRVYGSSEFPTYCCGGPEDDEVIAAETDGRPIAPAEHRLDGVVDGVGELLVRGPELFLGYLDAGLDDEAFTPDGFFRTGDLAAERDGAIVIRGRKKDVIIRNGENISVREVEDLLYQHPAIKEVAIVAVPDATTGERAAAFVVPEATPVTLDELAAYLDGCHIARQKYPELLACVDALPKTASGKVQRFLLRDEAAARFGVLSEDA